MPDGGDGAGRSGQKSLILQVRRIDIYALQMIDTVDVYICRYVDTGAGAWGRVSTARRCTDPTSAATSAPRLVLEKVHPKVRNHGEGPY